MNINLDVEKLEEVMKAFYVLTGIRFIIFDADYHEVLAYPKEHCPFCAVMKAHPESAYHCYLSDKKSFEECKKCGDLIVYQCHAGLIEATVPLKENGALIGYVMFGQITDSKDKAKLQKNVEAVCKKYHFDSVEMSEKMSRVKYRNQEQIIAASKILETCTSYILLKEMITPKNDRIIRQMDEYINENMAMQISVKDLCAELAISRTQLYEICRKHLQIGIAKYIKNKRLNKAKELLKYSTMSVTEISSAVGFPDYNYFCKVFKQYAKKSPKSYRNS